MSVSGLSSGVAAITAGGWHTCALLTTGGVKCWGKNTYGQLGNNTTTQRLTPVDVSGLTSGVAAISAGENHTCALLTTGGVKCWGLNSTGQLGNNSITQSNVPVDVSNLTSGVASLDAGGTHTCALTTSGGMKCWGDNTNGQLGDGTNTQRLVPTDVSGLTSGVTIITAGITHSCAVTTGSVLKCWGSNSDGQLGNGTLVSSNTPLNTNFPALVSYTYGSSHKHAVTALSSGESYTYDANGNMITRVEGGLTYTQTFNAENRLISVVVSGQTTTFIYDGDGNLVKKIKPDGSKTIYVGGIYEVNKTSGGTVTGTVTYYPAAGAMRIGSTLYYALKDHLGSASVVTDTSGNTVGEDRFYPFGETRFTTGTMQTDKLFTGQRDTGLGIYYFNARFYSPKLGRFLSADTIVPGYANPQNLNRYSYVLNMPIIATDPTGHKCVSAGAGDCMNGGGTRINGSSSIANTSRTSVYTPQPRRGSNDAHDRHRSTSTLIVSPTATPTAAATPACTSPNNGCATNISAQATYVAGQPTMLAWQCQNNQFQCFGNVPLTNTPYPTSTPNPNAQNPLSYLRPVLVPTDFGPDANALWENLLNGLPLLGFPASSLMDVVTGAISTAATYGTYAVTTVGNAAINVSNTIGNVVNNAAWAASNAMDFGLSPTLPIFYIPSPYDLFPVSSQEPVYN